MRSGPGLGRVAALVRDGKLDKAEGSARSLLEGFPGEHEGHDHLGMGYEARGGPKTSPRLFRGREGILTPYLPAQGNPHSCVS